jgi:hypothetical protein
MTVKNSAVKNWLSSLVIDYCEGRYDEFLRKISPRVKEIEADDQGNIAIVGNTDIKVGLMPSLDPLTTLVQVGFALFGMYWPFLSEVQQAWKETQKYWRAKVRESRRTS